ncbi:hypothetical protein EDB85DRAFT_2160399 [Lactarius pseudohatsudake]|nr:hypothetical protein EDB85DRAFT_2160399 [Lactarius pseudohatsudake]
MALGSLGSGPGGETEEAISIFAEGTFEHQIELVWYISSGRPDTERAPYFQSIRQTLAVEDSQNPLFNDVARRGEVSAVVCWNVKRLGEGTDRDIVEFLYFPTSGY